MEKYQSKLDLFDTEIAIKKLKDFFEDSLARELSLMRVSAPLFVSPETGLNDNLNGIERPVSFDTLDGKQLQIVQSLAKWKRMALYRYDIRDKKGLYTDMNAIRRDEVTDNLHSIYVDQWDWEMKITKEERTREKYMEVVDAIYKVLKETDEFIHTEYDVFKKKLPDKIFYITTQELEDKYPDLSPKEREYQIVKEHGAVSIMQIGGALKSGIPHDGRSPDYDDWSLNGDIVVYHEALDCALELSSMGVRVDKDALLNQLKLANKEDRIPMEYHQAIINEVLPYTIGGGIGQSRLCMFFLEKIHVGEVQSSYWNETIQKECSEKNIQLL